MKIFDFNVRIESSRHNLWTSLLRNFEITLCGIWGVLTAVGLLETPLFANEMKNLDFNVWIVSSRYIFWVWLLRNFEISAICLTERLTLVGYESVMEAQWKILTKCLQKLKVIWTSSLHSIQCKGRHLPIRFCLWDTRNLYFVHNYGSYEVQ